MFLESAPHYVFAHQQFYQYVLPLYDKLTTTDVFVRLYFSTYGYPNVSGETWRQHIPVASLSLTSGQHFQPLRGREGKKTTTSKYSPALRLSERPDLHEVWPYTHKEVRVPPCSNKHTEVD